MQRVARLAERKRPERKRGISMRLLNIEAESIIADVGLQLNLGLAVRPHASETLHSLSSRLAMDAISVWSGILPGSRRLG